MHQRATGIIQDEKARCSCLVFGLLDNLATPPTQMLLPSYGLPTISAVHLLMQFHCKGWFIFLPSIYSIHISFKLLFLKYKSSKFCFFHSQKFLKHMMSPPHHHHHLKLFFLLCPRSQLMVLPSTSSLSHTRIMLFNTSLPSHMLCTCLQYLCSLAFTWPHKDSAQQSTLVRIFSLAFPSPSSWIRNPSSVPLSNQEYTIVTILLIFSMRLRAT